VSGSRWLADDAARDPATGLWWAWVHPQHDSFAYEEATAWVALAAADLVDEPGASELRTCVEQALPRLTERVASRGGLGRGGRTYVFDTAVCLAAWQAWQGGAADPATARALLATVDAFFARRQAVDGGPCLGREGPQTRWSEAWGAHLLWLAVALARAGRQARAVELVNELLPRVLRADGLLRVHSAADQVYSHSALYGAEGLLAAGQRDIAAGVVEAVLQAPDRDGLVPAWLAPARGPGRTDATAQAVMLAGTIGAAVSEERLQSARRALQRYTDACGGLRYATDSDDINCCATAFALRMASTSRN